VKGHPFLLLVLVAGLAVGCGGVGGPVTGAPSHHRVNGFANTDSGFARPGFWTVQKFRLNRLWQAVTGDRPQPPISPVETDGAALRANPASATVTWIGHATLLFQLEGVNILTDPIWSERAGPTSYLGPRRLVPPGLRFEALPPIHVVLISHDHYDSLDRRTIERLAATHRPLFLVPLGFKAWFGGLGVTGVVELDWWQSHVVGGVTFTSVPAQHWSARTPWDTDRRLWSGWALLGRERRAYFAGDTGYYDGFHEIGRRLGPFDLAAIAIGAYEPPAMMRHSHTTPEEALRIFADVGGHRFVAIHWGTFNLGDEPIDEPPRRLEAEARRRGLDPDAIWILRPGETRRW
jgi:L-ascorbate metabolism protein UlaG (beta-lactamase superfamily)